jgi:hypothetical protein
LFQLVVEAIGCIVVGHGGEEERVSETRSRKTSHEGGVVLLKKTIK